MTDLNRIRSVPMNLLGWFGAVREYLWLHPYVGAAAFLGALALVAVFAPAAERIPESQRIADKARARLSSDQLRLHASVVEQADQAFVDRDVADRSHRIPLEHDVDRLGVVEVDPVGELLGPRQRRRADRFEALDVGLEPAVPAGLEGPVADAVEAVLAGDDIGLEQPVPGAVIDHLGRAGPVFGKLARRVSRCRTRRRGNAKCTEKRRGNPPGGWVRDDHGNRPPGCSNART